MALRGISIKENSTVNRKIIDDYYTGDVTEDCKAHEIIRMKWNMKHMPYSVNDEVVKAYACRDTNDWIDGEEDWE